MNKADKQRKVMTRTPKVWTGLPIVGDPKRFDIGIKVSQGSILGPQLNLRQASPQYMKK